MKQEKLFGDSSAAMYETNEVSAKRKTTTK